MIDVSICACVFVYTVILCAASSIYLSLTRTVRFLFCLCYALSFFVVYVSATTFCLYVYIATHNFLVFCCCCCFCVNVYVFLCFSHTRSPFAMFVRMICFGPSFFFSFLNLFGSCLSVVCSNTPICMWESMQPVIIPMITYVVYICVYFVAYARVFVIGAAAACCFGSGAFSDDLGLFVQLFPSHHKIFYAPLLRYLLPDCSIHRAPNVYLILFHYANTRTHSMLGPYIQLNCRINEHELFYLINVCIRNATHN